MQECDSILEFLSNPWVMVQVIHYPSVQYQWLVAATAEVLRFEQQLVDFQHLPLLDTPLIHDLARALRFILDFLKQRIISCFCGLRHLIYEHKFGCHASASEFVVDVDEMPIDFDLILYQLKKVRSEEGQRIIKAFKRMCWDESNKGNLAKPKDRSTGCASNQARLYQPRYWANGVKDNNFFFPGIAKETECSEHRRCDSCDEMMEEQIKERKSFEDYYKTAPIYKDVYITLKKMVQFYGDHLAERFPPEAAKTDSFLAQLVNKELLYLQWKFEKTERRIHTI